MGRAPCCDKANVKRGPWSPEEDETLKTYLETHGIGGNWIALPKKAGLRRCGKSCRLRWLNYLRPDIKHGGFTEEEDNTICTLYGQIGSRWSFIASKLPGRTDNDVKNHWNTKLKKKIKAGKICLKALTHNDDLPSNQSPTQNAKITQNSDFPASQNQNSPTLALSKLDNCENNMSFDQLHLKDDVVSQIGASSSNNNVSIPMMTMSQENSSISNSSSSIPRNSKKFELLQEQAGGGDDGSMEPFMDFGFGSPFDLVSGLNCHERFSDFAPSYSEWDDFSYAAISLR